MRVFLKNYLVKVDPIEWTDSEQTEIIAFFVKCPKCYRRQWNKTSDLYQSRDGTANNVRCKSCGLGKPKKVFHGSPKLKWDVASLKEFSPKGTGWRSVFRDGSSM